MSDTRPAPELARLATCRQEVRQNRGRRGAETGRRAAQASASSSSAPLSSRSSVCPAAPQRAAMEVSRAAVRSHLTSRWMAAVNSRKESATWSASSSTKVIFTFSADRRGGAFSKLIVRQSTGIILLPIPWAKAISSSQTFDLTESGETTKIITSADVIISSIRSHQESSAEIPVVTLPGSSVDRSKSVKHPSLSNVDESQTTKSRSFLE